MKSINIPAYKISYKKSSAPSLSVPDASITTGQQAAMIFKEVYSSEGCAPAAKEYCYILMVNNGNKPIGYAKISEGGIDGTVMDNRLIIKAALDICATGIILCHNHPSGNPMPGKSDIEMTKTLHRACKLMDIKLLDHIILTPGGEYYSFDQESCGRITTRTRAKAIEYEL